MEYSFAGADVFLLLLFHSCNASAQGQHTVFILPGYKVRSNPSSQVSDLPGPFFPYHPKNKRHIWTSLSVLMRGSELGFST